RAYLRNGEREKADSTFQEAVRLAQAQPDAEHQVPQMILYWAWTRRYVGDWNRYVNAPSHRVPPEQELEQDLVGQQELETSRKFITNGMTLYHRLPITVPKRIDGHVLLIRLLRNRGESEAAAEQQDKIIEYLNKIEPQMAAASRIAVVANGYE